MTSYELHDASNTCNSTVCWTVCSGHHRKKRESRLQWNPSRRTSNVENVLCHGTIMNQWPQVISTLVCYWFFLTIPQCTRFMFCYDMLFTHNMMTESIGSIFPVTGHCEGNHRWIPLTKASKAELWCFLWPAPAQTVQKTIVTPMIWQPPRSLWRHCKDLPGHGTWLS